jgi:choline dehydrogenase-like flavoprotein
VYPDPVSGNPRYAYTPSAFDRAHITEGVIAIAKICYVTGALEIHVSMQGLKPFVRTAAEASTLTSEAGDPGITDPSFRAWLEELKRIGNTPPIGSFACAHQMGSNRMSVRRQDGVVDPKGKVWGTEDLYVADASIFPSASGVNPMVTNMAISDWISRGISKELRGKSGDVKL